MTTPRDSSLRGGSNHSSRPAQSGRPFFVIVLAGIATEALKFAGFVAALAAGGYILIQILTPWIDR